MTTNAKSYAVLEKLKQDNRIETVFAQVSVLMKENIENIYTIEKFQKFVYSGIVEGQSYQLSYDGIKGQDIIILDEADSFSVKTFDQCIKAYYSNALETGSSDAGAIERYRKERDLSSTSSPAQIRAEFYQKSFTTSNLGTLKTFCQAAMTRMESFSDLARPEDLEREETKKGSESAAAADGNELQEFLLKYSPNGLYYTSLEMNAFKTRETTVDRLTGFSRVLSGINTSGLDSIAVASVTRLQAVISRLEDSGLLELASYAFEISNFAKKRFRSKQALEAGIYNEDGTANVIDEAVDLPWLTTLQETIERLRRDPIGFATINYYFPSIITFLLDALAAAGDYSNNGKGGGGPDNDPALFVDSLEKAFGMGSNGKAIFTLAFRASNTSQRINSVLEASPFRSNIAPESPDIFHLRLGAANFYVPPVSIDVNSMFKTGSLTGGAIRQKNSPKFNTGYRETTIRMRLFFPNYEEIWGLSIDGTSTVSVNDDFQIDFRSGGASEGRIDKFLSSLRGLVAAFRYSPILPIKNQYLNTVHGVTGVALSNMTVSTVPNFPFALAVDIELLNFNHKPFLPMISDFNQAVHWGKYRQYMGKAASALHQYVNQDFLIKISDTKNSGINNPEDLEDTAIGSQPTSTLVDVLAAANETTKQNDVLTMNVGKEWADGNHIIFYAPAETQTKIFLPSTSSFRSEQEKIFGDLGGGIWSSLLGSFGIDLNSDASYGLSLGETADISLANAFQKSTYSLILTSLDILTAGVNTDSYTEKVYLFLVASFMGENSSKINSQQKDWLKDRDSDTTQYPTTAVTYIFQKLPLTKPIDGSTKNTEPMSLNNIKARFKNISKNPTAYLDWVTDYTLQEFEDRTSKTKDRDQVKEDVARAFNVGLYRRFFKSGPIQALMETSRLNGGYERDEDGNITRNNTFRFNEWEVPMIKVALDEGSVIVNGVTVGLANNFAKLQIQMQDEPSYQHIGGKDSTINISMTVIGEKELIKLKSMFDHISGLARLEHATGVIGFLGIKNVITALCGIKYAMPLNYSVNTIPNYPHCYSVELTLVDFDIFQQQREKLSSSQQEELIREFSAKRNPFLRIKQLWSSFNAYPDFPLEVRNSATNEVVGHLDPDFYFRSFEMFDRDVINSLSSQTPKVQAHEFDNGINLGDIGLVATVSTKILEFLRLYTTSNDDAITRGINVPQLMRDYVDSIGITQEQFLAIFNSVVSTNTTGFTPNVKKELLTDYIDILPASEANPYLTEIKSAPLRQGDLSPNSLDLRMMVEGALSGDRSLPNEEYVSFDPDDVDFHKIIHVVPASDEESVSKGQMPAICTTAIGQYYGYIDISNGRFYLTVGGQNVEKHPENGNYKFTSNYMVDTQMPEMGNTTVNSGTVGAVALSEYQNAYEDSSVYSHLEKMMVDTSYRDVSGRMLRAFPTYMLWLIDEGGYFAGVKLFDNFYGLQSIIDFSVVSSEDLLGDTLVLRLSNLYAKLTTKEDSLIFNPNMEDGKPVNLSDGITNIINRTLNISRNILGHMRNEYVVDIANIRLKPGVRVHLRGGYGSNPNSLQTLFNGIITNVEQGEIVTVTAQSDAIELGAVINSTSKKGDSGKIDGGMDTGLWMSEPRDLMVRLLSMGSSRTREAISRSTRGTVFSENRFGIRHFGSILYEPLTEGEKLKNQNIRSNIAGALKHAGGNQAFVTKSRDVVSGFAQNTRGNTIDAMGQLWANFSSDVDLELFKRNIYPGNGTGIAQFLGGDIDDGWLTAASFTETQNKNDRLDGYLGRLTDVAWNNLLADSQSVSDTEANQALDQMVAGKELIASKRGGLVKGAFSMAAIGIGGVLGGPLVTAGFVGAGLLGLVSGRGGTNLFKTMGLISPNDDDDIPGFDEVSFRAQTYMRTVWDMFQVCARLLPNYIVAVRPFEDRSTIFYGKPHWLYTSGVVPVTTGYPGDEKAAELGIVPPKTKEPDADLSMILDSINRNSNPLADMAAYMGAFEPNEAFNTTMSEMAESGGIYSPTAALSGKIMDFFSRPASTFINTKNNEIVAKMPTTKGFVNVGYHLPILEDGKVIDIIQNQTSLPHKQLNNLPPRYRFPYFSVTESAVLDDAPELVVFDRGDSDSEYRSPDITGLLNVVKNDRDSTKQGGNKYNNLNAMTALELKFFDKTKLTLASSNDIVNLELPINLDELIIDAEINFQPNAQYVRMPLPNFTIDGNSYQGFNVIDPSEVNDEFSREYKPELYGQLTYQEWGSPTTAEDEQFYIAMRWPYNAPNKGAFKNAYGFSELYGTVEDYKKRKVLVYNPANGRSVVCRPAYFMWGENEDTAAIVSPDAAYFLGIITRIAGEDRDAAWYNQTADTSGILDNSGFRLVPKAQDCYMAFVPDSIPVGVVSGAVPTSPFTKVSGSSGEAIEDETSFLVGFGVQAQTDTSGQAYRIPQRGDEFVNNALNIYTPYESEFLDVSQLVKYGGNPLNVGDGKSYFEAVLTAPPDSDFDFLSRDNLYQILTDEKQGAGGNLNARRSAFIPVYSPLDQVGFQAAQLWNESFDPAVSVIAGDGRSFYDADIIWNEFRFLYHTYDSVKSIFFEMFGLDPNSEEPFPPYLQQILTGKNPREGMIEKFGKSNDSALDEFAILLGSDYIGGLNNSSLGSNSNTQEDSFKEALEFARKNYIDAPLSEGGLVEYFNTFVTAQFKAVHDNFLSFEVLQGIIGPTSSSSGDDDGVSNNAAAEFDAEALTPRQLFFIMVGIFRQRMWEDPYARAWLVLKPDRKRGFLTVGTGGGSNGVWSFKSVDKIFREFINPYNDYAKPSKKTKFLKLLASTRSEGNNSSDIVFDFADGINNFFESNIGPIWGAVANGLSGFMNMFKLNMQQMGYALSEVGNFGKQANILNKALNDSIYYSLGRPGSLLRAVDNPFTREYGEPVIEIREPFQRIHYLSSFSHIITNQIQENSSGVSTVVTAVSDGKYPVTVALDKGAPAERQVEKTVETGIIFDNFIGSGLTGMLHPLFHPMETFRGVAKNAQGTPDELSARRVALAHLKESLKDIYGGELTVIGNPDIRPHDLVYIADVYERMYGIFEVEQVVHHFTSELGFVTVITPNAFVTVNDPARWFISSWFDSWMNVQTIRNDTRMYLDQMRSGNSGIAVGGNISLDALSEALSPQLTGGMQFTHGSTALVKDLMANQLATSLPGQAESFISAQPKSNLNNFNVIAGSLAAVTPIVGQLAWKGWKWVRDNVLDQHGAYIQYLNKNGQPMDAGFSYNQGMVVGRYHSKVLLPGILGVRSKVRSPEGNAYIRSDDLFKSLGWQEKEIKDLVRYISYENALVHARVLKLSGLGPEKAGLQPEFRVLCKVLEFVDGDTVKVEDCLSPGTTFQVRFDGIDTAETNVQKANVLPEDAALGSGEISVLDLTTPGGRAKAYVRDKLKDRIFVLRVPATRDSTKVMLEDDYDPGTRMNVKSNYEQDVFERVLGTFFYYLPLSNIETHKATVASIFRKTGMTADIAKETVRQSLYDKSPFLVKFEQLYKSINETVSVDYFDYTNQTDTISALSSDSRKAFNNLVYIKVLEEIYNKTSDWPMVSWDEYYSDGYPVTLNWELVANNLAKVFTKNLQVPSDSVQGANPAIPAPVSQ